MTKEVTADFRQAPRWHWGILGICVAVLLFLMLFQDHLISVFLGFVIFGCTGILITRKVEPETLKLFVVVYGTSAIVAVAIFAIYTMRYGNGYLGGGSDDLLYELDALNFIQGHGIFDYASIRGSVVADGHNSVGYIYIISILIRIWDLMGGFHTMVPRFMNCMFLALTAVWTFRLGRRLGLDERLAFAAAWVAGLLPVSVFNTVHTFRDTITAFLSLLIIDVWTPGKGGESHYPPMQRWITTFISLVVLSQLRAFQAVVGLGTVCLALGLQSPRFRRIKLWVYVTLFVATILLLTIFFHGLNSDLFDKYSKFEEMYDSYRLGLSSGLAQKVFATPMPAGLILRLGYAMIIPLPMVYTEVERTFQGLGTLFQFFFLPFFFLGIWRSLRVPARFPLLFSFGIMFLGMVLFTFTERHLMMFFPLGSLLAVLGYKAHAKARFRIWRSMFLLGAMLAVSYIFFKAG